jgi:hypothetical protein
MSLEMAHKVIVPPKKIISRSFLNSGTLIVNILQELNTLYLTRFVEPSKLLDHPKQKPRKGGGLRQMNTCRQVPLQVNFFYITTFGDSFYQSNLSTLENYSYLEIKNNNNNKNGLFNCKNNPHSVQHIFGMDG